MKQLLQRKNILTKQILNQESKIFQINQLRVELVKAMGICEAFNELLFELFDHLEFINTAEIPFEAELIKAHKAIYFLYGQIENIQAKLENSAPQTVEIGLNFEWLRAVNKYLLAIKSRLESEITIFNVRE